MDSVNKALQLGARLMQVAISNPRRLSHIFGTALAAAREVSPASLDLLRLPTVYVEDLLPAEAEVRATLALFPKVNASISLLEFMALVLLLRKTPAKAVFEFGTYKGVSITQLALNASADARVFTLDLPEQPSDTAFNIAFQKDAVIARERGKGGLVPEDVRGRITFLKCDSAVFDETPYREQIDFVFVDGAHNMDYVRNDSEKGWKMLRQGGIIAWHDFVPGDPDVVRYLLHCPYAPKRIAATSLAFAQKE